MILVLCTGCMMMSKEHYLTVSGDQVNRNNDSGGYYDLTWVRFGKGNNGIIKVEEYSTEIWSQDYYSKELAFGFILPIIPRFGSWSGVTTTDRWIRINNTTSNKEVILQTIIAETTPTYPIEYTNSRYPDHCKKNNRIEINQEASISIPSNQFIWICLPECSKYKIILIMGKEVIPVELNETWGITWWMITV